MKGEHYHYKLTPRLQRGCATIEFLFYSKVPYEYSLSEVLGMDYERLECDCGEGNE
jgi:hypothetical protein